MNRVARLSCPAQTPSWNVIIDFWVGLNCACTIWLDIVRLRIGRASPSTVSRCPFKLLVLHSNIGRVSLGESSCLPPSLTNSHLYWHCYNLCGRDRVMWDVGSHHTVHMFICYLLKLARVESCLCEATCWCCWKITSIRLMVSNNFVNPISIVKFEANLFSKIENVGFCKPFQ